MPFIFGPGTGGRRININLEEGNRGVSSHIRELNVIESWQLAESYHSRVWELTFPAAI